ncbi:DUF6115 domain-containing protein [Defluviitalea saccharophila]|uniref:DUF2802 domain-containing protein n=1 Tax=Defluviitalea saccharophila TaxID=879970 RepID=A0ABZ2Y8D3_9FIRM
MPQMEIVTVMILFVISVVAIVVVIGLIFMKDKSESNYNLMMIDQQIKVEKELKERIDEADQMLKELNQFSSYIQSELEKKHKELLFLYQLIEEKEKKLAISNGGELQDYLSDIKEKKEELEVHNILNNKYYNSIIELYKSGKDTASIAKELNIGKGEVELILGLARTR